MAAFTENFRGALHGFNRTDVVQFIQRQTMEHEKQLRLLRDENIRLQEALTAAREEADAGRLLKEAMEAEQRHAQEAPVAEEAPQTETAPSDFNEKELAAYRRAELTERIARERAAASAERMREIFAQTDEKLNLTARDLATILSAFRNDFEKLQELLKTAQSIVDESSSDLRSAAEVCEY